MRRWIQVIGVFLTLGSFAFFGSYIWKHAGNWPEVRLNAAGILCIIALILFQIAVAIACSLAWRGIIGFSGSQPFSARRSIVIFCKSQFAKYVPGNVAHHLGRLLLAKQEGLSAKRATLSQTIELLWNLGCAGTLAVLGLGQLVEVNAQAVEFLQSPWILSLAAVAAVLLPALVFSPALEILKKRFPNRVSQDAQLKITLPKSLSCLAAYFLSFLFLGVALDGLAVYIFELPPSSIAYASSVCALAWLAGFITPGSPAGIGVRDTILLLALEPLYGAEAASALTLSHRLLTAAGDLAVYIFGLSLDRIGNRSPAA